MIIGKLRELTRVLGGIKGIDRDWQENWENGKGISRELKGIGIDFGLNRKQNLTKNEGMTNEQTKTTNKLTTNKQSH